jgi:predicted metalloprotease with PDZ domain
MPLIVRAGCLLAALGVSVSEGAVPQTRSAPISDVRYDVTFDTTTAATQTIHVEMAFRTNGTDPVVLSLPAWSPGSYELDNFARYVVGFSARSGTTALDWDKVDYDTWRVDPNGTRDIIVALDYRADTLDVGMSWSAADFTFFNGTNLFLYPEGGDLLFPATVSVHTSPGWQVATGLTPGGAPNTYRAADYHELVDMPTLIGRFDLDSVQVDGHWYRLATYPAGALSGGARSTMWEQIRKMMPPMAAVFGEVPWQTYTIEMVFPASFGGGSALEHRNSHLGIYTPQAIAMLADNPLLASVVAHETFHAWNVKRLRPAQMVPYEYDRPQPTELLWVSEGITDYYADLALVRGGIVPPEGFYGVTGNKITQVDNTPPVALEDASLSTWIQPQDGTAFIYYPKGSLAGFLLDIMIRDASDNRRSLDDVMRRLYEDTYRQGRGFTTDQWWQAVSAAAGGRGFEDFAARYIDGRAPFLWAQVLPLAGLAIVTDTTRRAFIGIDTNQDDRGIRITGVTPGSSAAEAGIEVGDYVRRVGDVEVQDDQFGANFRARYANEPEGTPLEIVVERDGADVTLSTHLRFARDVRRRITVDERAGPKAVRVRNGILTGRVDR